MSDAVAKPANSQIQLKESQQTTGTCFLRLDEQLLECFHVYCTTCSSQLSVRKDGDEDAENDCKVVLQCPTCRSCRGYPPNVPTSDGIGAGGDLKGQGIFQDGLLSNHSVVNLVDVDVEQLSCELFSVITKQTTACRVKKTAQSVYEVSCVPHLRGEHQLRVRIDGEHVRGSPFAVITKVPVKNIGRPIMVLRGLERPWGVVVKPDGEILVAEHYEHFVSVCNTEGKKKVFAAYSGLEGRVTFEDPRGIALDHQGNLLIVDGKLCCVQKFTLGGKLLAKVGKKGDQIQEFTSPIGIGVHPLNQKVYIADNANHRIQVLNSDLTFCQVFGVRGSGNGELNFPWDVAFDSFGYVYVVDSWNNRVQVFTEDGKHLRHFGQKGSQGSKLLWPSSVCIDAENFVYVTEAQNHCVSVFTSEGEFVTSFGSKGTRYGEFMEPTGIAVDRYRVVYVSDSGNNRLQLF